MKELKILLLTGVTCCACLGTKNGLAQPIIPPTYPETLIGTAGANIYTFNSDMLELPNGGTVQATVCDPYSGPNTGVYIHVWNSFGSNTNIHIPTSGESEPDIVIGNDMNVPNGYVVGVVYRDANGFAHFSTYKLSNVGSGPITAAPDADTVLSTTHVSYPHIDLVPDYSVSIGGLPAMHRFAICFMMSAASSPVLVETNGDLSNPHPMSPLTPIVSGTFSNGADIAMSYDPNTQLNHVYMIANMGSTIAQAEVTLNALMPPYATPSAPMVTNLTLPPGCTNFLLPRIEAMGINQLSSGTITPWVIGTMVYDIGFGILHVYQYNPQIGTWQLCSSGPLSKADNFGVCIAAGSGFPDANICNRNYNIGWYSALPGVGYLTRVIDATTGSISAFAPDFFVANLYSITLTALKYSIGLTSCSNSGNNLLTSWFDGSPNYRIWYKLKPGITGYKPAPTSIPEIVKGQVVISPNPAHDNFRVQLDRPVAHFTIKLINVDGRILKSQQASGVDAIVDIAAFPAGMYFIEIINGTNKATQSLAKL